MHFKLFSSFFQFLPLQVEETYFFRDGLNQGLIRFLPPGGRNLPTLYWNPTPTPFQIQSFLLNYTTFTQLQ